MPQTAFVTGGTGFVGLNLVQELDRQGWQVTALHRPTSDLAYLRRFPVDLVEGSLTDIDSLRRALPARIDVVFHVAGDTNFWSRNNDRQTAVNVTGTENMIRVAQEKEAGCFIHTSSISAWGEVTGQITEETPQQGHRSWINYERSKWAGAEAALRGTASGMKVVVLCPGVVMGPFDTTSWGELFFVVRDDAFPFSPPGVTTVAHVHEVVKAHIAAVEHGRSGESYILAGHDATIADIVAETAACLGKEPRPIVSPFILRALARLAAMGAALTGKEPVMTPEMADSFSRKSVSFASDKAIRELGYKIVPLKTCVRDCYDWLVAEELL